MMNKRRKLNLIFSLLVVASVLLGIGGSVSAKPSNPPPRNGNGKDKNKITHAERQDAAAKAYQRGALNPLMILGTGQPVTSGVTADGLTAQAVSEAVTAAAWAPGAAPYYFSHPNYANSPLPEVTAIETPVGNDVTMDRANATDGIPDVFVVLTGSSLPAGFITSFQIWNQAGSGSFHAYVLRPVSGLYRVIFDSGLLTVPALADPLVSELVTYGVANLAVQAGDVLAFYGQGIPYDTTKGDYVSFPIVPSPPLQGSVIELGTGVYPDSKEKRTYSFGAQVIDINAGGFQVTGGMRKFVDPLPQFGSDIPIAVPDKTTYSGSDYYEIELGEYTQQMHADLLNPTTLRGYRQVNMGGSPYSYLGPAIVVQKDTPVRIKFINSLPTGLDGNLFIPVDSTVMGSGPGPNLDGAVYGDPQNPLCSTLDPVNGLKPDGCYAENRATLHLHGGISPWISDGTPHQWITPAGENTDYPQGVSVKPVPDMGAAGCDGETDGCMTFYYTNQQSARLMFYHDHAWGITRLNVYAGEAAAYIITDDTEAGLVNAGTIPGADATIPLVVQDKTFVPSDAQLALQDETWDAARWGGEGGLWVPHVYSPAQNPGDPSGVNAYGRWAYGPWFWPPTNAVDFPPIDNPYYDPTCNPDLGWCQPPLMPSTPYISMGMESFNDTPVVNGMAYPTITLEPKAYRFRILNAANDRFFNLSLYQAVDANGVLCDAANTAPAPESTGVACTEVFLNPAEVAAALLDPAGVFPTPVAGTEGPDWIAIGTEGGFLPAPVVVPAQPTTWVTDPTVFNAGNVDQHSLLIAPAERHDVIVDFSAFAGQTLILYNDAPAAFPARDPRYDYYTGNPDLRESGGAPSTLPGYGPNTRTVMQIKIVGTPSAPFDMTALENAFAHQSDGSGVFESGQHPIIVGQGAYNSAYGTLFTGNDGLVQIYDTSLNFGRLVDPDVTTNPGPPYVTSTPTQRLAMTLRPKMIQDEMGEAFELEYGRMSGFLGVETPNAQAGMQNMILHPYVYPPDEIIKGVELPPGVVVTPIATADDGTQIWKITHNGVDTHPIHWHLYDVQLINRVGWDGIIRPPDPTELGWKDTVRVSPLEDTIVALRPIIPQLPVVWNGLPNSIRLLDPSLPDGHYLHHANTTQQEAMGMPIFAFNPDGEPVDIINHYVNYGWEYVFHCHILSHEEMDMMHSQVVGIAPKAPTFVSAVASGSGGNRNYTVTWIDNSKNETAFVIERSSSSTGPWSILATVPSNRLNVGPGTGTRTFVDVTRNTYYYRVYAINVVGDTWDYSNPAFNQIPPGGGWPTLTLDSRGGALSTITAPSNLTASAAAKNRKTATVTLNWMDNAAIETGFLIQRADNAAFTLGVVNSTVAGADIQTFTQDVARGKTYYYRVLAFNDTTQSAWSNSVSVTTP
ncbi:MAG TPA: multicopper oxidase domain-containing protein [Anaerolineales bacterium]|nr:multicopper oxidase domain-containing protein [Anaerolineales bacterium]